MVLLLSPAKTLDFSATTHSNYSQPSFLKESDQLVKVLRKKSAGEIKSLMKVSDKIADLNVVRYKEFSTPFTPQNAKQAIFAFKGDVYQGLAVEEFDQTDLDFAQQHLLILSGLYGVLRPLDLMQPYRLEMGTKLMNKVGKNLYDFWDTKITKQINTEANQSTSTAIINLASKEYFHSVKTDLLEKELYTIHFKEWRNEKLKVIAFNAKKARGRMAHLVIKNKLTQVEALKKLDVMGYTFNEELSDSYNFVFTK